jgi:hypothetical protein
MTYKTYEYNETVESSFFDREFDSKEEAITRANEIGIGGEVWECDGEEENAIYAVREQKKSCYDCINFEDCNLFKRACSGYKALFTKKQLEMIYSEKTKVEDKHTYKFKDVKSGIVYESEIKTLVSHAVNHPRNWDKAELAINDDLAGKIIEYVID